MKIFLSILVLLGAQLVAAEAIVVGSKNFTENYILGELIAQSIEDHHQLPVERKLGLGGTGLIYEALQAGKIDLYVEYTGTISEAILKNPKIQSREELTKALEAVGLSLGPSLGFNNTYALAVRRDFALKNQLKKISDLRRNSDKYRFAFSYEFMARADGFEAMKKEYQLPISSQIKRMDHSLVYDAIQSEQVDIIEVYSTDAKIDKLDLVVLEDDLKFFPVYEAVILASTQFVKRHPEVWKGLSRLENILDEASMRKLNSEVDLEKKSFSQVISVFLEKAEPDAETIASRVWRRTKEHLFLVGVALLCSVGFGLPLGILAVRSRWLGQSILMLSSLVQTIPSLALLCFLIPVFGIGVLPALVALILYGLLPVVVNTFEGLKSLDFKLVEASQSLSLTKWQRLIHIEIPLASPQILAGVKTSAIISIGTATLAALIGGGGYGAPIITGLALNDISIILIGAIPAAIFAILAHFLFEVLRILLIPKGLRL